MSPSGGTNRWACVVAVEQLDRHATDACSCVSVDGSSTGSSGSGAAKYGCQPKLTGTGMTPVLVSVVRCVRPSGRRWAATSSVCGYGNERSHSGWAPKSSRARSDVSSWATTSKCGAAVDEAVDRVAVAVVAHAGRVAVQLHLAVGVVGEPVRPRVQQRDAHRLAALDVGLEPVAQPEQLLAVAGQRRAHHRRGRLEARDQRAGAQLTHACTPAPAGPGRRGRCGRSRAAGRWRARRGGSWRRRRARRAAPRRAAGRRRA